LPEGHVPSELLHRAFCQIRKGDWPASLTELHDDSLRYRLVRLRAVNLLRGCRFDDEVIHRPAVVRPEPTRGYSGAITSIDPKNSS
jgi:hypothetical protein